mmetsp:Transcript_5462/g.12672  ORF Transcript_5462/g.12672 Transcript_5462/m.12672 type:complete len:235 (-) Transcript_5462:13-717(-)
MPIQAPDLGSLPLRLQPPPMRDLDRSGSVELTKSSGTTPGPPRSSPPGPTTSSSTRARSACWRTRVRLKPVTSHWKRSYSKGYCTCSLSLRSATVSVSSTCSGAPGKLSMCSCPSAPVPPPAFLVGLAILGSGRPAIFARWASTLRSRFSSRSLRTRSSSATCSSKSTFSAARFLSSASSSTGSLGVRLRLDPRLPGDESSIGRPPSRGEHGSSGSGPGVNTTCLGGGSSRLGR